MEEAPSNVVLVSILEARVPVTIDNIHQIFKPYGEVNKIIMFVKNQVLHALVQMSSVDQAHTAKIHLEGKDMFQGCCHLRIAFSKLNDLQVKQNGPRMRDFTSPEFSSGFGGGAFPGQPQYLFPSPAGFSPFGFDSKGGLSGFDGFGGDQKGCVLLVNNLVADRFTPDRLFMLFGVYGDVMRVKILYNKRESAMIQFANGQQAELARLHLNHLNLYGKELNITTSKHNEISMPRGDGSGSDESAHLTKDFSSSPIHRFKNRAQNAKNINAPSQVLHVSNLPDEITEEELRKLFGQEQVGAPVVQFFKTNRKMAYIRMDSIQDAVHSLMKLHNHRLKERYIKVSFSPKNPSQIGDED